MEKEQTYLYPDNIQKLDELIIGSNKIIGGGDLIKLGDLIPIIIGGGDFPHIWLSVKPGNEIITIVKNNISLNPQILIDKVSSERKLIIRTEKEIIINSYMITDKKCIILHIDLRPIGINLFGNEDELNLGQMKFSGNTFQNTRYVFGSD